MDASESAVTTLDDLGILTGTDKNLFVNNYLKHYDLLFSPLRDAEFNLIEIGVYNGNSMKLWSRYFKNAHIIGVDINQSCKQYEVDRVRIEIGNVENPEFLLDLASRFTPTVVIDDGSHRADHQIFTFERLFPALKPGGIYVVEDLHLQLTEPDASRLRGDTPISSVEYFLKIAERRLASNVQQRQFHGLATYFATAIESIQFIQQALIMRKAAEAPAPEALLAKLRPLVEESGHYINWLKLGLWLQDLGRFPEAVDALRRSIAAGPNEVAARQYLSHLLERQGDVPGAITVLEPLPPLVRSHKELVKRIEERIADLRKRV
jgi:tetratricopeptide (TPR) repeat protein